MQNDQTDDDANEAIENTDSTRPGEADIDQQDIIERLTLDKAGRVLAELKGQIAEGRKVAQDQLNAGVSSDDFQNLTNFVKATNAADEIADAFWKTTHV